MNAISGIRIICYFGTRVFVKIFEYSSQPQFLQERPSHDIQQLQRYAAVAKVFIKSNATLPSSASAERLFGAAGQILLPRRNRLQDDMFENCCF